MKCGKQATHKIVKIEKNQVFDLYLCQEHAIEKSPYLKPKIPLSEILASFLSQEQAAQTGAEGEANIKCKTCGLPLTAYRKTLFLGCPDCYESFQPQLMQDLRKFHGNVKHIGRKPGGGKEAPATAGEIIPVPEALPEPPPKIAEPSVEQGLKEKAPDPLAEITELTAQMNQAIAGEDFEKAAACRDRLKELRAKLKK